MTNDQSACDAIVSWKQVIGENAVISDPDQLACYTRSVCASQRQVVAVLRPISSVQVQQIVAIANECKVPLYPISCGKQWGMGSRLPVKDGAAIVDLSEMKRIFEVDTRFHYAVVEPGVTQRQLLDFIEQHSLPLMLNVTGSTSDTSLIGNALDRGVGYFDSRVHGISNMQVVLGNGQTIQTGFGHYANAKTKNLYRHGVGPSLDGLFLQGNFGIVTSACVDLMPKPDDHMSAVIKIDTEDNLAVMVDTLVSLRSRGIFTTVAHIGNRERSYTTLAPLVYEQLLQSGAPDSETTRAKAVQMVQNAGFGPWSAAIGVLGTKQQLKLAKRELKKAVRGFGRAMFLNDRLIAKAKSIAGKFSFAPVIRNQLMMLKAIEPIYGYTAGKTSDKSLQSVYWASGDYSHLDEIDPDHSNSGVLFCLPIIPAAGSDVLEIVRTTRETFAQHGFEAAITVNLMDTKSMEGVVSLAFNRHDEQQTQAAHACIQEMEARYMELGFPPYRVGINSMHHVVRDDDPYWQTVRELKKALDPNSIIAPGRYNLT